MTKTELNKKEIEALLPHREPMLLIDKLTNIVHPYNLDLRGIEGISGGTAGTVKS